MPSSPCYKIILQNTRCRVLHSEQGTLLDEPAAIAMQYHADRREACVVAVGEDAAHLAERILEADARGWQGYLPVRLIPREQARWWPPPTLGTPSSIDPSSHNGESIVVWPLESLPQEARALEAMLRHVIVRALMKTGSHPLWTAFFRPSVEVELQISPLGDDAHDALVRALWSALGRNKVLARGEPLRLRGPRRTLQGLPRDLRESLVSMGVVWVLTMGFLAVWPTHGLMMLVGALMGTLSRLWELRNWLRS